MLLVPLSYSVAQNQIRLYDALAGPDSPMVKVNELVGVRVVESEGPLKGQLEFYFKHDLPDGTNILPYIHSRTQTLARPHEHDHAFAHANTMWSYMHARAHRNPSTFSRRAGIHD